MNIVKGFNTIADIQVERFRPYCHEKPIVMSHHSYHLTKQLGQVLYKAVRYFMNNYSSFSHLMPLADDDLRILEICNKYPLNVGTYRTDFLVNQQNEMKIIEMTTRQPLNGYFISGFTNRIGQEMAKTLRLENVIDDYPRFLEYFANEFAPTGKICIIKGNERLGDFKIYTSIFEAANVDCHIIELDDLSQKMHLLSGATVVEELNHAEIKKLPNSIIDELTAIKIHNDFRNLFLIHDKRFFYILTNPDFIERALTKEEADILNAFTIPSYIYPLHKEYFTDAYGNKDKYIIKHILYGKSEAVYAGCVTKEEDWKKIFDTENLEHMVLQPMLDQKKYIGKIGQEERNDFIAGTYLYFNEEYFGPGIYRASSFVVTNQGDDRKCDKIVAEVDENDDRVHHL